MARSALIERTPVPRRRGGYIYGAGCMLKALLWIIGIIFLIGLLVVIGIFDLLF